MKTYTLVISRAALNDILDAQSWYEKQRKGLSLDFELCLEGGYEDVLSNPVGFQIKYKTIRVKYISRFPYGIHYLIERDTIFVLGVFHTGKNPKKWIERTDLS